MTSELSFPAAVHERKLSERSFSIIVTGVSLGFFFTDFGCLYVSEAKHLNLTPILLLLRDLDLYIQGDTVG
jgi:hypothetical protein